MILLNIPQGSPEWYEARCGVITMSHAKALLTGGKGVTRRNYILDVAAERLSGQPIERIQTAAMQRGLELEPFAREAYKLETGVDMDVVGLAYLDESKRISASPDGILGTTTKGGVEIKCPYPRNHMRYIDVMGAKNQHEAQMQGNMWIFDAAYWDFVSYCPEFELMPLVLIRSERDQKMIDRIEESAKQAVKEVDKIFDYVKSVSYINRAGLADLGQRAKKHLEFIFCDGEVTL